MILLVIRKEHAYVYAYIGRGVVVVPVVYDGEVNVSREKETGTVTSDRCDNFLLFIKSKILRKDISRHMRIYADI